MKIVNLTPHNVNIINEDGSIRTIKASGTVARCTQSTQVVDTIDNIPITTTNFGDVVDLPLPQADTMFIVSRLVLTACSDRDDLLVPNDFVRDDNGNIIGCKSLAMR